MSTWAEVTIDYAVRREEPLRLGRGLEPLHLPLSPSCRPMRILGTVIQNIDSFGVGHRAGSRDQPHPRIGKASESPGPRNQREGSDLTLKLNTANPEVAGSLRLGMTATYMGEWNQAESRRVKNNPSHYMG